MANPLQIFPQEVWDMILDFVIDPQDIQSCLQACILFKNHLYPTRTTWAFSSVLPSLFKFLSNDDVLQCRLVSKHWLKGVDNFLQSDKFAPTLIQHLPKYSKRFKETSILTRIPKHHPLNLVWADLVREMRRHNENGGRLPENLNEILVRNIHQNQMKEFISVFGYNYKKNPFPSRTVVLIIIDQDIEDALQFLDLFGAHIWYLGLAVRFRRQGFYQILQLVWNALNRVPNLKHLFFGEDIGHAHHINEHDNSLDQFLTINPTPGLKYLQSINMITSNFVIKDKVKKAFIGSDVTIF